MTLVELISDKVDRPVKIVVIADFQTDRIGDYDKDTLRRVMDEQPDIILWCGDYIQVSDPATWDELCGQLREELQAVKFGAPLGVFAVGGNVDASGWPQIFSGFDVRLFTESDSLTVDGH